MQLLAAAMMPVQLLQAHQGQEKQLLQAAPQQLSKAMMLQLQQQRRRLRALAKWLTMLLQLVVALLWQLHLMPAQQQRSSLQELAAAAAAAVLLSLQQQQHQAAARPLPLQRMQPLLQQL